MIRDKKEFRPSLKSRPRLKILLPLEPATSLNNKPLADLMLHPTKVDAVLAATRSEDRETSKDSAKPSTKTTTFKKPRDGGRKHSRHSLG